MSFFQQIIDGSLISSERLMRAREFYSPFDKKTSAQAAFARWTERVSVQAPVGAARELAGLGDAELAELEAEFVRCPMRQQARWARFSMVCGTLLVVIACLGFGLQALADFGETTGRVLQITSAGYLVAGLAALGAAVASAFGNMSAALSYGTTGLYVGKLDEQHPWLYSASSLLRYEVAEDYRQRTLRERGALRGADFVMMRELAEAQDALERVRPARSVAEQLQALPLEAEAPGQEPRLIHVGPGRELVPVTPRGPFGIDERRLAGS